MEIKITTTILVYTYKDSGHHYCYEDALFVGSNLSSKISFLFNIEFMKVIYRDYALNIDNALGILRKIRLKLQKFKEK